MNNISIRASLGIGWEAFKRRPWYLIGLMLAFIVIFSISIGNAIVSALAYIAYGGYLSMMLAHLRGAHIKFDDMFAIDRRWISFAFLGIIKLCLIFVGFLCFIIPGIYLSIRWMFAEVLVIDQGMTPLQALKASSTLTEGVRWKLFFFTLVVIVLVLLGLVALVVGALVASVVATFAVLHIYEQLKGKLSVAATAPEADSVTIG